MSKRVAGQPHSSKSDTSSSRTGGTGAYVVNVLRRLIVGASVRLLPRRRVDGIEIVVFSGDGDPERYFTRVAGALELLRKYSPRRFAQIKRDLRRIALVARGGEVYDHALRTYMVDLRVLDGRSTEEAALAIVHEATHARLWNRKIATTPDNEARIETLCVGQEIDFASHLPNGTALIEHARAKLEQPWWGAAEREQRIEDQLKGLRVPSWILALRRMIRKYASRTRV
jgi:hypothetical protein